MQQSACFSSCTGGLIAIASNDGNIVIWHGIACQVVNTIQGPVDSIYGVCLSKDGKFLACAYKDQVIVWDTSIQGGSRIEHLNTNSIFVSKLVFSENGFVLLGYSVGGGIVVWNWRTSTQLFELSQGLLLQDAFLSEDGRCLYLCTSDAKVATIDLSTRNMHGCINLQDHVQRGIQGDIRAGDAGASMQIPSEQNPLSLSQDLLDILLQDGHAGGSTFENVQVNQSNIGCDW
eukprot:TRINITY_DN177_c2_g1_i7.p1 TRINITY_DN177_c2_g1~~TRINITY_DN177_c2_g1_i7.p1  ORF type:complete len:232 (+),score=18.00 TRINITY_DN177_c2_g1_i7:162-857(+)